MICNLTVHQCMVIGQKTLSELILDSCLLMSLIVSLILPHYASLLMNLHANDIKLFLMLFVTTVLLM